MRSAAERARERSARAARTLRHRADPRAALLRLWGSAPAALQIAVAATGGWAFAHHVLGHDTPLLATTVTITSLGFVRDARPVRVLETAIGMTVGITLSEVLLLGIGRGAWQLFVIILATLLVARLLSSNAAFAVAAGVQAVLVALLPAPPGGVFVRSVDGLVGGAVALLATARIPRDPRRQALREARRVFSECSYALTSLVTALRLGDATAADRALDRLRRTQPLIDAWSAAADSALSIARISPFLRRHLPELRAQRRVLDGMDLAVRNLRVISRRIDFLVVDGVRRPVLAELLATVSIGVTLLGQSLSDRRPRPSPSRTSCSWPCGWIRASSSPAPPWAR